MKKRGPSPEIMEQLITIYQNVKYLREQHGLSTKEFAEIIKIKEESLMLAEAGVETGCFYDIHLKNICVYFKVRADDLLKQNFRQP